MKQAICAFFVVALIAPIAMADDLNPPSWDRFEECTTYWNWQFTEDQSENAYGYWYPDERYPPEGGLGGYILANSTQDGWFEEYAGRYGIFTQTFGSIEIPLPNCDNPEMDEKTIRVQATWHTSGPFDDECPVYLGGEGCFEELERYELGTMTGWYYGLYEITIDYCPDMEWIYIYPETDMGLVLDQIIIDTHCIPEPASLSLLALGGLALLRRR